MTSATSLNKPNRVSNFFRFTLRKQTPLTLLVTAFSLLICPGVLINILLDELERTRRPEMSELFFSFSLIVFIIALGLMALLTVTNFNFLYSKKAGDVFHALPLTRNQLVLVRMFSSFVGAAFTMTVCFACLSVINFMPSVIGVDTATVLATFGAMLVMLFACSVFTAIFAVCSGGVFDFIVAVAAVNIGVPAICAIFINLLDSSTEGILSNNAEYLYTTPYVYAVMIVGTISKEGIAEIAKYFWQSGATVNFISVIVTVVFTVVCIILLSKLFKIRRSETAGEAYSFKFMPYIISVLVSIVGGYVLAYMFTGRGFSSAGFWLFFVIGALLCAITAGVIFTRGFKTVKRSLVSGAVSIGITVVLCVAVLFYGGWAEQYIPKKENIESITVGYNEDVIFTDNFDIILNIHKAAIEDMSDGDSIDDIIENEYKYADEIKDIDKIPEKITLADTIDNIYFTYNMKNGRKVTRRYYDLTAETFDPLFIEYMQSDEYIARYLDLSSMDSVVEVNLVDYGEDINNDVEISYSAVGIDTARALLNAYAKELKNADRDAFYEACDVVEVYGYSTMDYYEDFRVPESFTETRAILESISFKSGDTEWVGFED